MTLSRERLILHASDLHFGRHRPTKVQRFLALVRNDRPDAIVLSGDFVQVGSREEFALAEAFLSELTSISSAPLVGQPGNHDLPVAHLPARLAAPFARYRKAVGRHLVNRTVVGNLAILAVPTAHRFGRSDWWPLQDWSLGRLSEPAFRAALALRQNVATPAAWLVMHHHPWSSPQDAGLPPCTLPNDFAQRLTAAGFQAVLSGHTHQAGRSLCGELVNVSAGSACSDRLRGEANSINRLRVDPDGQLADCQVVAL